MIEEKCDKIEGCEEYISKQIQSRLYFWFQSNQVLFLRIKTSQPIFISQNSVTLSFFFAWQNVKDIDDAQK